MRKKNPFVSNKEGVEYNREIGCEKGGGVGKWSKSQYHYTRMSPAGRQAPLSIWQTQKTDGCKDTCAVEIKRSATRVVLQNVETYWGWKQRQQNVHHFNYTNKIHNILISTYVRWVSPTCFSTYVPSSVEKYANFCTKKFHKKLLFMSYIFL